MLIEYADETERKRALAKLIGVEDKTYIEVEGYKRMYAIADEDLDRENEEKTSAIHFVRFQFSLAAINAIKAGTIVKLGCEHPSYTMSTVIPQEKLAALTEDFK